MATGISYHTYDNSNNNNDDTRSSNPLSDLSSLANDETDELGRQILEHARDRQRLQHATATNSKSAFSKARPRPRIALTMENLERNNNASRNHSPDNRPTSPDSPETHAVVARRTVSESVTLHARRHSSMDPAEGSSPAHNVPMQWGRKGVRKNDFLRRISAVSSPVKVKEEEEQDEDDPDRIYRRRTVFTGDSPRSDVDWRNEALAALSGEDVQHDRAERGDQENDSIDRILELEREEEPGGDSPTSKISGRRALSGQSFSREEVEDLKGRGITTSRLDAFGSGIARRRIQMSKLPIYNPSDAGTEKESDQLSSIIATKSRPITVPRRELNHLTSGRGARDLLKELANASSSTAGSVAGSREKLPATRDTFSSRNKKVNAQGELLSSPRSANFRRSMSPERQNGRDLSRANSGIVRTLQTADADDAEDEIVGDRDDDRQRRTDAAPVVPSLPHSAAEELLEDPTANGLGDSTIHSLQDLLDANPDVDFSTVLDDETLALAEDVVLPVVRRPTSERQEEIIALQRMNDRLKAARTGLRDASRGLARVEYQVSEAEEEELEGGMSTKKRDSRHDHDDCTCTCSKHHQDITLGKLVRQAWRSWLNNFYTWPRGGRPRITWLGLLTFLFFAWWASELTLW